jgi:hypothetical protein
MFNQNKNKNNMKTIELECQECNGQGYDYVFVGCNKPASMCCGGCDAKIKCENCDGNGTIEVEAHDDYMDKMIDLLQYFYKNNT